MTVKPSSEPTRRPTDQRARAGDRKQCQACNTSPVIIIRPGTSNRLDAQAPFAAAGPPPAWDHGKRPNQARDARPARVRVNRAAPTNQSVTSVRTSWTCTLRPRSS